MNRQDLEALVNFVSSMSRDELIDAYKRMSQTLREESNPTVEMLTYIATIKAEIADRYHREQLDIDMETSPAVQH